MTCHARRESDQMRCARCGLVWDASDPEPPACAPRGLAPVLPPSTRQVIAARLRAALRSPFRTVELPRGLVRDIVNELERSQ